MCPEVAALPEPPGGTARLWDFHMAQTVAFTSKYQENLMLFKPSDIEYIQSDNYLARFCWGTAQANTQDLCWGLPLSSMPMPNQLLETVCQPSGVTNAE